MAKGNEIAELRKRARKGDADAYYDMCEWLERADNGFRVRILRKEYEDGKKNSENQAE